MSNEEKKIYQSETPSTSLRASLGMPPLKMVLVHAEDERRNAAAKPIRRPRKSREQIEKEKAILRLIERLNEEM